MSADTKFVSDYFERISDFFDQKFSLRTLGLEYCGEAPVLTGCTAKFSPALSFELPQDSASEISQEARIGLSCSGEVAGLCEFEQSLELSAEGDVVAGLEIGELLENLTVSTEAKVNALGGGDPDETSLEIEYGRGDVFVKGNACRNVHGEIETTVDMSMLWGTLLGGLQLSQKSGEGELSVGVAYTQGGLSLCCSAIRNSSYWRNLTFAAIHKTGTRRPDSLTVAAQFDLDLNSTSMPELKLGATMPWRSFSLRNTTPTVLDMLPSPSVWHLSATNSGSIASSWQFQDFQPGVGLLLSAGWHVNQIKLAKYQPALGLTISLEPAQGE